MIQERVEHGGGVSRRWTVILTNYKRLETRISRSSLREACVTSILEFLDDLGLAIVTRGKNILS